ncbi:protein NO VEIN domain-containing protein [Kitasatospora sp. NPDC059803]|uniref:protein NO VEIN domain-containing protein n=1 Tax=unclassified Kitasatospora TaxID=2633591 RepID=UPI0036588D2D
MRAALRWLRALRTDDIFRVRALFTSHDSFSDLTPGQYDDGLAWLRRIGLVPVPRQPVTQSPTEERLLRLQLLDRSLEAARPDWLDDSSGTASTKPELPLAGQRLAATLGLSSSDAATAVSKAWLVERARLGAAGENALVALLQRTVHAEVLHVSAVSDRFGYDIAVESDRCSVHLEVKSTSNADARVLFLSRHEYETMRADSAWYLVFLVLDRQDRLASVTTVAREWIADVVPVDRQTRSSQWASARLLVPSTALTPGIPAVRQWIRTDTASGPPGQNPSALLLAGTGTAPQ